MEADYLACQRLTIRPVHFDYLSLHRIGQDRFKSDARKSRNRAFNSKRWRYFKRMIEVRKVKLRRG
jgi:hypothetical protein